MSKVRLLTCHYIIVETTDNQTILIRWAVEWKLKSPLQCRELLKLVFRFNFTCPSFETTL